MENLSTLQPKPWLESGKAAIQTQVHLESKSIFLAPSEPPSQTPWPTQVCALLCHLTETWEFLWVEIPKSKGEVVCSFQDQHVAEVWEHH